MFFLNPRDLSENLSPWSIRSKDDIYQFWSSLLHCCFCKEHNIVLSKAGFTFFYNWIKSFMGSFLNLHMQILFHKIFLTIHDKEVPCLKVSFFLANHSKFKCQPISKIFLKFLLILMCHQEKKKILLNYLFRKIVAIKKMLSQIGFIPVVLSFGSLCLHDSLVAISTFANFVLRFDVRS